MATFKNNEIKAQALRRTKIETTFEYRPILGEILGFWRRSSSKRIGNEIILYINTPLNEYDALIVNGEEIDIKRSTPKELI